MTWNPIETAPKDGSHVVAWWGGAWRVAYWLDNTAFSERPWKGWKPLSMQPWPKGEPTHWMIPEPPQ